MKHYLFALSAIVLSFTVWYYFTHPLSAKVAINDHILLVNLAVTQREKERGLGGRRNLAPNRGMLFVYDHPEQFEFWMKDMRFPLDFIWISGKTIVDITRNVPSPLEGERPAAVKPAVAVDKVLEVNAGIVDRLGIQVGDRVIFR